MLKNEKKFEYKIVVVGMNHKRRTTRVQSKKVEPLNRAIDCDSLIRGSNAVIGNFIYHLSFQNISQI